MKNKKNITIKYSDEVESTFHPTASTIKRQDYKITLNSTPDNKNVEFFIKNLKNSSIISSIEKDVFVNSDSRLHFKLDDIHCVFDYSENPYLDCDTIRNNIEFKDVRFIFMSQYLYDHKYIYDEIEQKTKIKIIPFIMGCDDSMIDIKEEYKIEKIKYLANMTFSVRFNNAFRSKWISHVSNNDKFLIEKMGRKDYISSLNSCKWGLCLHDNESFLNLKTSKETEYILLGMPLALSYQPCYPFPFYPNEHYLYLKSYKDLSLLESVDPHPFLKKTQEIRENCFMPNGMVRLMVNSVFVHNYNRKLTSYMGFFEQRARQKDLHISL